MKNFKNLNEDVILNILNFILNTDCITYDLENNINYINLLLVNKLFHKIIKKYYYKNCKLVPFLNISETRLYRKQCIYHTIFNDQEINLLRISFRKSKITNSKKFIFRSIYDSNMFDFIHTDTKENMISLKIKCKNYFGNSVIFGSNNCCNGKGCEMKWILA